MSSSSSSNKKIIVAFDLYGTLLSTESIAKELASHFDGDDDKAKSVAALWRRYQLEYTWRLNCMKKYQDFSEITRNSLQHALKEHNLSLDSEATEKLMKAYDSLSTFPDVGPALERLGQASNIECVVFSNGTKTMVGNSVDKSEELAPYKNVFSQMVTVDDVRAFKPAPEVYKHLASCTGMTENMGGMWLVSGNPFDVVGARAMGMQAAWVDRAGNGWQDQLGEGPTVVVKSLEDVAAVVIEHAKKSTS